MEKLFYICRVGKTKVSFPTDVTNKQVNKNLNEKIRTGIYSIGEQIVPQVFECLKMKNGEVQIEKITVCGKRTYIFIL